MENYFHARVTVLINFIDYHSMKNRIRQFIQNPEKKTMTVEEVRGIAKANQASLIQWPRLFYWGSGHRFALIDKK